MCKCVYIYIYIYLLHVFGFVCTDLCVLLRMLLYVPASWYSVGVYVRVCVCNDIQTNKHIYIYVHVLQH